MIVQNVGTDVRDYTASKLTIMSYEFLPQWEPQTRNTWSVSECAFGRVRLEEQQDALRHVLRCWNHNIA
jgi:hypothetical protein